MQVVGYDWTVVMCMLLKRKGRCMKGMPPASMYYIDERQKRIYIYILNEASLRSCTFRYLFLELPTMRNPKPYPQPD